MNIGLEVFFAEKVEKQVDTCNIVLSVLRVVFSKRSFPALWRSKKT